MSAKKYTLKIGFEGNPKELPDVSSYVFDRTGKLLFTSPIKEGTISFEADSEQVTDARVFVGLTLAEKPSAGITLATMKKIKAYEPVLGNALVDGNAELLPVPRDIYNCWGYNICRVRGKVVRPVQHGDVVQYMPVRNAKVHICEVDKIPIIIRRIPRDILIKLTERLIEYIRKPFPPPPPPEEFEEFEYDIRVIDSTPERIAEMNSNLINRFDNGLAMKDIKPVQPEKASLSSHTGMVIEDARLSSFVTNLEQAYSVKNYDRIETLLDTNQRYWKKYIVLLPWLDLFFYDLDELGVVYTDAYGRFDLPVPYYSCDDHPDIYFWVEYSIGGTWETVYKPRARTTTIWNYPCGNETRIVIRDPRVPGNGTPVTPAGKSVAVMSIGHMVSISEIQGSASGPNQGLTTNGEPFGGNIEPVVSFGSGLNSDSAHFYYRWSYRRMDTTDSWKAMDRDTYRHYAEIMPDGRQIFKAYHLGPKVIETETNLFEINPVLPRSPIATTSFWTPLINSRENAASSFFQTHLLKGGNAAAAAGKYELKLELFKHDPSSRTVTRVNFTDENVILQIPTVPAPFTVPAPATRVIPVDNTSIHPSSIEDYLIRDASRKVIAFRLVLRVDNNPCVAGIDQPTLNGHPAEPCGIMEYTSRNDNVTMSFNASHRNGFATYNFSTVRGSTGSYYAATANAWTNSGVVPSVVDPNVNGFVLNTVIDRHVKQLHVSDLLLNNHIVDPATGERCDKAAFSSALFVYAKAIDGYSRLDYLDRFAHIGFAVVPK